MKIKTSKLTGTALDWAVAKCEGYDDIKRNPHAFDDRWIIRRTSDPHQWHWLDEYSPSTNWAQGGPIIERERLELFDCAYLELHEQWKSVHTPDGLEAHFYFQVYGPTPLIAAMRCFCRSKLGDEIEVPEELT